METNEKPDANEERKISDAYDARILRHESYDKVIAAAKAKHKDSIEWILSQVQKEAALGKNEFVVPAGKVEQVRDPEVLMVLRDLGFVVRTIDKRFPFALFFSWNGVYIEITW